MTKKKLVLVKTLSVFQNKYVFEVDAKTDIAKFVEKLKLDDDDIEEFSQKHLGETCESYTVISNKAYHKLFNKENNYLKSWDKKTKENLINRRGDK